MFIDWNQNGILDDEGEIYEVGTLTNSTGADDVSASMDILVPDEAMTGETRVRITKTYGDPTSPALINSCAIEFDAFGQGNFPGYGQALDFTVDVETLSSDRFDRNALSVYPTPTKDILNIEYKSTLNAVKVYSLLGREVYSSNIASN